MILVVGSTGLLGSEVCQLLASKGIPIRALVRQTSTAAKIERLKNFGAEISAGDLTNPTSLVAACNGIQGIICTASAQKSFVQGINDFQTVDLHGIKGLISEAEKAGVSRFIFTSFASSIKLRSPLIEAKRSVEKYLRESSLVYTIIRSSFFMETWFSPTAGFDPWQGRATIYGDGVRPIRWISVRTVAQVIVTALYNEETYNTTVEVAGPEALGPSQVVPIFEEAGQHPFEVTYVPEKELYADRKAAADPYIQSWLSLLIGYAHGESGKNSTRQYSIPKRLISVKDYGEAFYKLKH